MANATRENAAIQARMRERAPQRQIRKSDAASDPLTSGNADASTVRKLRAGDLVKNSADWWKKGRKFGCADHPEMSVTLYVPTLGAWCPCGKALVA